jgi:hypothetical protein
MKSVGRRDVIRVLVIALDVVVADGPGDALLEFA